MTGSDSAYVAADGGSGATLLSLLRHGAPALVSVDSPRHAGLLLVVEPVSKRLVPAIADIYRAIPAPRRALVIDTGDPWSERPAGERELDQALPGLRRVDADPQLERIVAAARELPATSEQPRVVPEATTIPLPSAHERELATELIVLLLGPLQTFAAGPIRLLLVCDGEQVVSAHVEIGYAHRGVVQRMREAAWMDGLRLAETLDPLAPVAGRLAYVTALERLAGETPEPGVAGAREAALSLERAENWLWWLERFATLLAHDRLAGKAHALAAEIGDARRALWPEPAGMWLRPGGGCPACERAGLARLADLAPRVGALLRMLQRDRLLHLRLLGVGAVDARRAREAGITGPVLQASAEGTGDCWARMTFRVRRAQEDLLYAARTLETVPGATGQRPFNRVPGGAAQVKVDGPRGELFVAMTSDGGERATRLEWRTPSAATVSVIGDLLHGVTLADAETIVASLDLAMAEADG